MTAEYPTPRETEKPKPPRPAPPSPQPPQRPAPPCPQPVQEPTRETTADFLNLNTNNAPNQEIPTEKKLKSEESFDFFGMMEKETDETFGEFLSGNPTDKPQVGL